MSFILYVSNDQEQRSRKDQAPIISPFEKKKKSLH